MRTETPLFKLSRQKQKKRAKDKKPEELELNCEWSFCQESHVSMDSFMKHVEGHVQELMMTSRDLSEKQEEEERHVCSWRECDFECENELEIARHVNFHAFHTKIKYIGERVIKETGISPCLLEESNRNIVPELKDPLRYDLKFIFNPKSKSFKRVPCRCQASR